MTDNKSIRFIFPPNISYKTNRKKTHNNSIFGPHPFYLSSKHWIMIMPFYPCNRWMITPSFLQKLDEVLPLHPCNGWMDDNSIWQIIIPSAAAKLDLLLGNRALANALLPDPNNLANVSLFPTRWRCPLKYCFKNQGPIKSFFLQNIWIDVFWRFCWNLPINRLWTLGPAIREAYP